MAAKSSLLIKPSEASPNIGCAAPQEGGTGSAFNQSQLHVRETRGTPTAHANYLANGEAAERGTHRV